MGKQPRSKRQAERQKTPRPVDSQLKRLATAFRKAILRCDPQDLPINFRRFPKGDYTGFCYVLGHYLREMGLAPVRYVFGRNDAGDRHAWLEIGKVIVDITACRFDDAAKPVLVTKDFTWHRQFQHEAVRVPVDMDKYDRSTAVTFWLANRLIVGVLPESLQPTKRIGLSPPFVDWRTEARLWAAQRIRDEEQAAKRGMPPLPFGFAEFFAWQVRQPVELEQHLQDKLERLVKSEPDRLDVLFYSFAYAFRFVLAKQTPVPRTRDIPLYWHSKGMTRAGLESHLTEVQELAESISEIHRNTIFLGEYLLAFLSDEDGQKIRELPATLGSHRKLLADIDKRFAIPKKKQVIRQRDDALLFLVAHVRDKTGQPNWLALSAVVNFWFGYIRETKWLKSPQKALKTDEVKLRMASVVSG